MMDLAKGEMDNLHPVVDKVSVQLKAGRRISMMRMQKT